MRKTAAPATSSSSSVVAVGQQRSVTTLQETLASQVPEKQAEMARLKKEHGSHVYVAGAYIMRVHC